MPVRCLTVFDVAVPAAFWLWGLLTLVLTAVLAFLAGIGFARASAAWRLGRARRQVARLIPLVIDALQSADHACGCLAEIAALRMTAVQIEQLASTRASLVETWSRIDERQQQTELDDALETRRFAQAAAEFALQWIMQPLDERTGVPDRPAFDANLNLLLAEGTQARVTSGMLLVRIDRLAPLQKRLGTQGAAQLVDRMARLLCRSIRDKDLVIRFSTDTFAVLMPAIDQATGERLAATIRGAVRDHHFRLDEAGPEVFVTASFGYTRLHPHDHAEGAVSRAIDALAKSERRGRNQLHLHDGQRLLHCDAG